MSPWTKHMLYDDLIKCMCTWYVVCQQQADINWHLFQEFENQVTLLKRGSVKILIWENMCIKMFQGYYGKKRVCNNG